MVRPSVLVALIGLQPDQVLVTLKENQPIYTVFVHTKESESALTGSRGILKKGGFHREAEGGGWEARMLSDPDDPREIYDTIVKIVSDLTERFPGAEVLVDFSSGTTSMTGAAPLAAVDAGAIPVFVRGLRGADGAVTSGSEVVFRVDSEPMERERLMAVVKRAWSSFDYATAEQALLAITSRKPDPYVQTVLTAARGFIAWDMMELDRARALLGHVGSYMGRPRMEFLARGAADSKKLRISLMEGRPPSRGPGGKPAVSYTLVHHLILNAQRRATRGRFADGLARLYRAVELYAQISLIVNDPPISTANVDLTALDRSTAAALERFKASDGKVRIGLQHAYMLLKMLNHPLKEVHSRWERRLNAALELRNRSILAHGLESVSREQFREAHGVIVAFINDADATLGQRPFDRRLQFPGELPPIPEK